MQKLNCWEIKKCGREPNGYNVKGFGICPAAMDNSSNGINNGNNGGRICWSVAGTFCKGKVQGVFARKTSSCMICEVYKQVRYEENSKTFILLKSPKHLDIGYK